MSESQDKAFEIFVKRAISSIQKEAWGRSRDIKELREACGTFLALLEHHERGRSYDGSLAIAVLNPLTLACNCNNTKIVEISLGCLHKLVVTAQSQNQLRSDTLLLVIKLVMKCGESANEVLQLSVIRALLTSSTAEHFVPHGDSLMSAVIKLVMKCGESANEVLQLSVIRALLTFSTAEHFVAHGDSLMSAVRTVFNLALGSEDENIKRTAANALLQMLNTIVKRVTAFHLHPHSAPSTPSRRASDGHLPTGHSSEDKQDRQGQAEDNVQKVLLEARIAQFASLAENRDLQGLEAAIEESAAGAECPETTDPGHRLSTKLSSSSNKGKDDVPELVSQSSLASHAFHASQGGQDTEGEAQVAPPPPSSQRPSGGGASSLQPAPVQTKARPMSLTVLERDVLLVLSAFCKLASREAGLTEVESYLHQGKLLSLELLVKNPQHSWGNVRDDFCRALRPPLCITLLRNCAASDPSAFQLATKLLSAVLLQPKLRKPKLRQPSCDRGLKCGWAPSSNPLFVLRPIEKERHDLLTLYTVLSSLRQLCSDPQLLVDLFTNYDCDLQAPNLYERTVTALGVLVAMTDTEAPNLLERTLIALGVLVAMTDTEKAQEHAARLAAIREAALRCISCVVHCLSAWAAPLREAHVRCSPSSLESSGGGGGGGGGGGSGAHDLERGDEDGSVVDGVAELAGASEAEHFEASKAHKSSLTTGLDLFNSQPIKGMRYMLKVSVMHAFVNSQRFNTPFTIYLPPPHPLPRATVSVMHAFVDLQRFNGMTLDVVLRQPLYKFRLPGEASAMHAFVSVMHAFVDLQRFNGMTLDVALRQLLYKFRLPGEAQKIDRIMEKFSERYCSDNPNTFGNADNAYILSFAIIMLNTDAHNPLAEKMLNKKSFVEMNTQPVPELEAIFDRIVNNEIMMVETGAKGVGGTASSTQLAAAMGMRLLALPFLPLARGWGRVQRADMTEQQRKREIMQTVEREVVRGAGGLWHTSSHAAHTRPMLSISGACILDALSYGLSVTTDSTRVGALLTSASTLVELAALLGLEQVCEQCVAAMVKVAGLASPAAYASNEEARQLAALKSLLGLGLSPVRTLLGPSWLMVLRTASQLETLAVELCRFDSPPGARPSAGPSGGGSAANSAALNPFNKMFQALGWGGVPGAPASLQGQPPNVSTTSSGVQLITVRVGGRTSKGGGEASELLLKAANGASLVVWAKASLYTGITNACLHQVISAHSGWHILLELLHRAARDPSELVVEQSLTTLKLVVPALHQELAKGSVSHLRDVIETCKAVISSKVSNNVSCLASVEIVESFACRLAKGGWQLPGQLSKGSGEMSATRQPSEAAVQGQSNGGSLYHAPSSPEPGHPSDHAVDPWLLLFGSLKELSECERPAVATATGHPPDHAVDPWLLLLGCLNELSECERPAVATAASRALFNLMDTYGHNLSPAAWHYVMGHIMPHLFQMPAPDPPQELEIMEGYLHRFIDQMDAVPPGHRTEMLGALASTALDWFRHGTKPFAVASMSASTALDWFRHGTKPFAVASMSASTALDWFRHGTKPFAVASMSGLEQKEPVYWAHLLSVLESTAAAEIQDVMGLVRRCRQLAREVEGSDGSLLDPHQRHSTAPACCPGVSTSMPGMAGIKSPLLDVPRKQLQQRSHTLLIMQRLLVHIHKLCTSTQVQSLIADILVRNVRTLMHFNLTEGVEVAGDWGRGWQLWTESPCTDIAGASSHVNSSTASKVHIQPILTARQADSDTNSVTEAPPPMHGDSETDEDVADGILEAGSLSTALERVSESASRSRKQDKAAAARGEGDRSTGGGRGEGDAGHQKASDLDTAMLGNTSPKACSSQGKTEASEARASMGPTRVMLLSSDVSDEPDLGLVRLELEAATAGLEILRQFVEAEKSTDLGGSRESCSSSLWKSLVDFCIFIITANAAAQCCEPRQEGNRSSSSSRGGGGGGSLQQPSGKAAADNTWHLATRDGVLMTAINILCRTLGGDGFDGGGGGESQSEPGLMSAEVTASLLKLVSRQHHGVRLAVAEYFSRALPTASEAEMKTAISMFVGVHIKSSSKVGA
eukprot:gene8680-34127_t